MTQDLKELGHRIVMRHITGQLPPNLNDILDTREEADGVAESLNEFIQRNPEIQREAKLRVIVEPHQDRFRLLIAVTPLHVPELIDIFSPSDPIP